jgi:hypothetical protein
MSVLKKTEEYGKEDDKETDGEDSGDDEFLAFTQLHGVRGIQSLEISETQAFLICEIALTS